MPHIPRTANMSGVPAELTTVPRRPRRSPRPPVPYHGAYEHEEPFRARGPGRSFVPRLSIRNDPGPEPARIFKQLFGKEVERDERTGELVRPASRDAEA